MRLTESINNVLNESIPGPVLKSAKSDFKKAKGSFDGAVDYLGDIADDIRTYDPKTAARVTELYRQMLKVQSTFGKVKL
jgi:hypothetical protein